MQKIETNQSSGLTDGTKKNENRNLKLGEEIKEHRNYGKGQLAASATSA